MKKYINDDDFQNIDPLIKMAIIHYQFESIHPFYDGNGRTGRIINILYLVQKGLLDIPVLYLSGYIIDNKADYYNLLQKVGRENDWETWIVWMLKGVEETALQTIVLIRRIKELMEDYKNKIRTNLPKIYSQDLINNLFRHPYTKVEFVERDLLVSRNTSIKYLNLLIKENLLEKKRMLDTNYYFNQNLVKLLTNPTYD